MVILGIWDGHDAGAALVVGGQLVAAVNEERFTRRKLEIRFPVHSIECCLQIANPPSPPTSTSWSAAPVILPRRSLAGSRN